MDYIDNLIETTIKKIAADDPKKPDGSDYEHNLYYLPEQDEEGKSVTPTTDGSVVTPAHPVTPPTATPAVAPVAPVQTPVTTAAPSATKPVSATPEVAPESTTEDKEKKEKKDKKDTQESFTKAFDEGKPYRSVFLYTYTKPKVASVFDTFDFGVKDDSYFSHTREALHTLKIGVTITSKQSQEHESWIETYYSTRPSEALSNNTVNNREFTEMLTHSDVFLGYEEKKTVVSSSSGVSEHDLKKFHENIYLEQLKPQLDAMRDALIKKEEPEKEKEQISNVLNYTEIGDNKEIYIEPNGSNKGKMLYSVVLNEYADKAKTQLSGRDSRDGLTLADASELLRNTITGMGKKVPITPNRGKKFKGNILQNAGKALRNQITKRLPGGKS